MSIRRTAPKNSALRRSPSRRSTAIPRLGRKSAPQVRTPPPPAPFDVAADIRAEHEELGWIHLMNVMNAIDQVD